MNRGIFHARGLDSVAGPRRRRILCLDDNQDFLLLLRAILERHGYDVWTTDDEEEAVCLLAFADYIDLFTQDIDRISRGAGLDLLSMLQTSRGLGGVPVLIISGYPLTMAAEFMANRGLETCVSLAGYLQKPFTFDELLACCDSIIGNV